MDQCLIVNKRVLAGKREALNVDTNMSENLLVLMKMLQCVLQLHKSVISNDIVVNNVAEL